MANLRLMISKWWFTLLLGAVYIGIFHLWMFLSRPGIILTGLFGSGILGIVFLRVDRGGYFLNRWDRLFHAAVILDILLEGLLIPLHDQYGFYLCALGFAIVLGGYRARQLRMRTGRTSY